MKNPNDLTIEILKDIRGELKDIRGELRQTNERVDGLGERVDELGRRIVDSELRTATALTDLAGSVREMTTFLRGQADLRPRVEACEGDIAELKRRVAS